jgi:hypothetical protein
MTPRRGGYSPQTPETPMSRRHPSDVGRAEVETRPCAFRRLQGEELAWAARSPAPGGALGLVLLRLGAHPSKLVGASTAQGSCGQRRSEFSLLLKPPGGL